MQLIVRAILAMTLGAVSLSGFSAESCLWGAQGVYPNENLSSEDKEKIDYVRAQLTLLQNLQHPVNQGLILTNLPSWFPIILQDDMEHDNPCHVEFANLIYKSIFAGDQIEFSPLLFKRIEAIGNLYDVRTAMPIKSKLLIQLFLTPEASYSDWIDSGSSGKPDVIPEKSEVRNLVAMQLEKSNLLLNQSDYRLFLADLATGGTDDGTSVILAGEYNKLFDYYLTIASDPQSRLVGQKILEVWIQQAEARLSEPNSSFEVQIEVLNSIGQYAVPYGLKMSAEGLLQKIIKNEGNFPLSESIYEGPAKLLQAAKQAYLRMNP